MVDITIRGAGIFGLSIAWACIQRGAAVRVIDPDGVGAGSSGGVVGALAPHVPENWNAKKEFQLESLLSAGAFWAGVEAASGLSSGYARTGRLQPVADDNALRLAEARSENARTLWKGQANWNVVRQSTPWAPPSPTGWLIHDDLSARLHPAQACAALSRAISERGGQITSDGPEAGAVIHATGWQGLNALSRALGRQIGNGIKGQAALLAHAAPDLPQIFADGLHIVPHGEGTTAIGSTSERDFDDPGAVDGQVEELIDKARGLLPQLREAAVIRCWAGVRPRARTRAPLLGRWPDRQGHFVANGGFKIGFGMAPKIAESMADFVLEGKDTIPEDFNIEAAL